MAACGAYGRQPRTACHARFCGGVCGRIDLERANAGRLSLAHGGGPLDLGAKPKT